MMLYGTTYYNAMAETNNTTVTKWTGDPESYTPAGPRTFINWYTPLRTSASSIL